MIPDFILFLLGNIAGNVLSFIYLDHKKAGPKFVGNLKRGLVICLMYRNKQERAIVWLFLLGVIVLFAALWPLPSFDLLSALTLAVILVTFVVLGYLIVIARIGRRYGVAYTPSLNWRVTQKLNDLCFYLPYLFAWFVILTYCSRGLDIIDAFAPMFVIPELLVLLVWGALVPGYLVYHASHTCYRRRDIRSLLRRGRAARSDFERNLAKSANESLSKFRVGGMPNIFFLDSGTGNVGALALKHEGNPTILVSSSDQMRSLSPDEINAVLIHEIAHLKEADPDSAEHALIMKRRAKALLLIYVIAGLIFTVEQLTTSAYQAPYYKDNAFVLYAGLVPVINAEVPLVLLLFGVLAMLTVFYVSALSFSSVRFTELRADFTAMVETEKPFSLAQAVYKLEGKNWTEESGRESTEHFEDIFQIEAKEIRFPALSAYIPSSKRAKLAQLTDSLLSGKVRLEFQEKYEKTPISTLGLDEMYYRRADAIYKTIREHEGSLDLKTCLREAEKKLLEPESKIEKLLRLRRDGVWGMREKVTPLAPEEFFAVFASIMRMKIARVDYQPDVQQ